MNPGTSFTYKIRMNSFTSTKGFVKMGMCNFFKEENNAEGDERMEIGGRCERWVS